MYRYEGLQNLNTVPGEMNMKVLGITGGVGSGKSTVLEYLRESYGAYLIECDDVGRKLQEPGEICYRPMIELFGRQVVKEDNSIDRRAVAQMVFRDSRLREELNAIVHPAVKKRVNQLITEHQDSPLIVVEAALLLDDHYDEICDEIWYIYADEDTRRRRLKDSRGYTDERITQMFRSQRADESFRALCALTIDNSSENVQNTFWQLDNALARRDIAKIS